MKSGKRIITVLMWLLMTSTLIVAQNSCSRIVGYYTSWSIYNRDYHVTDIPADKIGYINYAFAKISDGQLILGDAYADVEKLYPGDVDHSDSLRGSFHQLKKLKKAHPHIRTLISIGGWTWSDKFSDVALSSDSRARFAASCVKFIQKHGFDGIDIDWEYPVSGGDPDNITRPEDKKNFTLLLAELRRQLDASGDYLLTIAAPANPAVIHNLELARIYDYLDWFNVMTYNLHGPWSTGVGEVTNFNAPLYSTSYTELNGPSSFNLATIIHTYLQHGVPPKKIFLGLPFFARGYGNVENYNSGLYAPYSGAAPAGSWGKGVFAYWDLKENYINNDEYTPYWHDEARVPWLYSRSKGIMITYDDPPSIAEKCAFADSLGLRGVAFWEFSADKHSDLIDAVHTVFQK